MLFPGVHVLDRGDAKQQPVLVAILDIAMGMSFLTARDGRKVPAQGKVLPYVINIIINKRQGSAYH